MKITKRELKKMIKSMVEESNLVESGVVEDTRDVALQEIISKASKKLNEQVYDGNIKNLDEFAEDLFEFIITKAQEYNWTDEA